jgi:two-component system heavy metal sensor histidine kinase CusS
MMGNRESVLSIAAPGQTPLLLVNPANIELPAVKPVPKDHVLNLADVQHLQGLNGCPSLPWPCPSTPATWAACNLPPAD